MTGWLLDANILSELRRPKPERKGLAFIAAQPLDRLAISVVTLAEIRFGIALVADIGHRGELNDWLAHKVRPMFERRVLPIGEDVMFKWRLLVEEGRKTGHTFSQPDLIIAATALHQGLTIVTRDVRDYERARAPHIQSLAWSASPSPSLSAAETAMNGYCDLQSLAEWALDFGTEREQVMGFGPCSR